MGITIPNNLVEELMEACGEGNVVTVPNKVDKLSKDFYWYSPVLKPQLEDKIADCAVLPEDLDQLKAVVAACCKFNTPITLRGGGTGNYGQCIPLYGGGVIDLTQFDRILSLEGGVARVEPGPRLDSQALGHPV